MKRPHHRFWLLAALACATATAAFAEDMKVRTFRGMCDASGAAYLGADHFVMADDESNILRVYSLEEGKDMPVSELDLGKFLGADAGKGRESDIEGCTQLGDTLYWITSHGRNKNGKWRPMRYRFFATKMIPQENGTFSLEPVGSANQRLLLGLLDLKDPQMLPYIGVAGTDDKTGRLAPKREGMNIESLCASEDGKFFYIGFRNPRPGGKAMLLPLFNPEAMVMDDKTEPRFGEPVYLDFGGLGIRGMEYSPFHRAHIIIAGSHNSKGSSQLYRWSGDRESKPQRLRDLGTFNPETVLVNPESGLLRMFSDDGSVLYRVPREESLVKLEDGRCECKNLKDPKKRAFRMVELDLPR